MSSPLFLEKSSHFSLKPSLKSVLAEPMVQVFPLNSGTHLGEGKPPVITSTKMDTRRSGASPARAGEAVRVRRPFETISEVFRRHASYRRVSQPVFFSPTKNGVD